MRGLARAGEIICEGEQVRWCKGEERGGFEARAGASAGTRRERSGAAVGRGQVRVRGRGGRGASEGGGGRLGGKGRAADENHGQGSSKTLGCPCRKLPPCNARRGDLERPLSDGRRITPQNELRGLGFWRRKTFEVDELGRC
ncbi:hypothetical protein M758_7G020000 [Ceratodon purpureus]|nr:hypothetical protein M758_7G020000 [Ceratodon purpureus]